MNLNDKALLLSLQISQWEARKLDKRLSKKTAEEVGASTKVIRVTKDLLPIQETLTAVHQHNTAIRTMYYAETLPWGLGGVNMLPSANYLNFMNKFRKLKSEGEIKKRLFLSQYDYLRERAPEALGEAFDERDYPPLSEVEKKFRIDLTVLPVPSNDFRVQLGNDEMERMKSEFEAKLTENNSIAMRHVWQKLYERVSKTAEVLSNPSTIFRDSLIENMLETCEVLTRLNVADDPNLEAMRQEVERKLAHTTPDALRLDPDFRKDKAAAAKEIMDRMSVFMGELK